MSTGFTRLVFLTLFAMLFSVAQICACASIQHQEPASAHTAHSTEHNASHSASAEHVTDSGDHSDNGLHDTSFCGEDCSHTFSDCEENIEFVLASGPAKIQSIEAAEPHPKPGLIADVATGRAFFAPSALAGLRWLDPPRQSVTPVSLKIRLLN